jgi:hypothetical protein
MSSQGDRRKVPPLGASIGAAEDAGAVQPPTGVIGAEASEHGKDQRSIFRLDEPAAGVCPDKRFDIRPRSPPCHVFP